MSLNEELNMLRVENLMLLGKLKQPQAMRLIQNRAAVVSLLQSMGATPKPSAPQSKPLISQPKVMVPVPAAIVNPAAVAANMTEGW